MEQTPQAVPAQRQGLTRQQVLRGAVLGAGALWAAPVVTGLGLTSAHADTTSGDKKKPDSDVLGEQFTKTPHKLPFTGMQVPLTETVAVGAGLVAAGTVAVAASRRRQHAATAGGPVIEGPVVDDATETDSPEGE